MSTRRILIDAGHGGSYPLGGSSPNRSTGPNGLREKDVVLDLARRIRRRVNGDSQVNLTRDDDVNLSLAERAALARRMGADIFLSLHLNHSDDPQHNAAEAFVARGADEASRSFADSVVERVSLDGELSNGGVRSANLGVLLPDRHASSTLACLLELGHLSNPRQARRLEDDVYRERLAAAIAEALEDQPIAPPVGPAALGRAAGGFSLSADVGTNGKNKQSDVLALKQRLHDLGFDWVSVGDSSVDKTLVNTINLVQSIVRGRFKVRGDGTVSVPGTTYDWLRAANAPRWQLMPEGSEGDGFINFERRDAKDNHDNGTDWLADVVSSAGEAYRNDYLADHPDAAVIAVNDTSVPHGGNTPDHGGHETGLECDLRLPRKDGESGSIKWTNTANYDRNAARAQLQALRGQALVSRIFFNDTALIGEKLCEFSSGHDDHVHVRIKPPGRIAPGAKAGDELFSESLDIGDGSPFVKTALEHTTGALKSLRRDAGNKSSEAFRGRATILKETGIKVDANPYVGVKPNELEAVIRAGFTSHQMPEVLLALWAKEGSTNSITAPEPISTASNAANAKTLLRNKIYFEDLGADHFIITTRKEGEDNKVDWSDAKAPDHEKHFKAKVKELVTDGLLDQDISSEINSELKVTKRGDGTLLVEPTTRFYALSLLLVDALFTRFQRMSFKQLGSISTELNYLHWNMGSNTFRTFLKSAEGHRKEPEHHVAGNPITIDQWALHTKPKSNEWRQARVNAVKFMHYVRSYREIFEPSINLIKPGIYDLRDAGRDRYSRTAGRGASGETVTLGYGVPGAKITDPFYRDRAEKGRKGKRSAHYGIDVSLSNKSGGDENDARRGLPVYAVVEPTLSISDLNNARVAKRNADKTYEKRKGLGIRGSGDAVLREARVNVQPWKPKSGGSYGGVLALACYYDYTKNDGTTGTFTLYVEYLHLITKDYLPKRRNGTLISEADWAATGKGIGFGPKMVDGATLSASELTSGQPLLVGYLGATQFPHVHIQVAYSKREKKYARSRRLDPTVILRDSVSTAMSFAMGGNVDLNYVVSLIPQPDKPSCWAGSMAMVVSYYRQKSVSAEDVVNEVGHSLRTSYDWSMLEDVRKHYGFKNVPLPSNMSFAPTPKEWHDWLLEHGPLWVTTHGAPSHAIVVHGIHGDLTPDGTTVDVLDPWDYTKTYDKDPIDFNPSNNGLELPKMAFRDLQRDFGNMGLSDYGNWRVLYISRVPETSTTSLGRGGGDSPFTDPMERAINHFDGIIFDPEAYDHTVEGFQEYLDATGVDHFSAEEMTRPNHPKIAKKHGYDHFLPKYEWWPRGAALSLLADKIRDLVGESVSMRNWWRPKGYNEDVGGAANSDHITAHGIDLDYKSADSRRKAEKWLLDQDKNESWLELSRGLGGRTTHVGILSPKGRRKWFYKSYTQSLERSLGRSGADRSYARLGNVGAVNGLAEGRWTTATGAPQPSVTGPLTDSEWRSLDLWLARGEVGVDPLTGDARHNAGVLADAIFCDRAGLELEGEDPLLCVIPSITRADRRVQQLVHQIEARGPIINWAGVDPDQRIRHVMRLLVNTHGYPVNGATGLVGNLFAESGVMPNRIEGSAAATPLRARNFQGTMTDFTAEQVMNRNRRLQQGPQRPGVGLAQWTTANRRAGLFQHQLAGHPAGARVLFDMEAQVDFLVNELGGAFRRVNAVLRRAGVSVNDASDEVLFNFERPGAVLSGGRLLPRTDPSLQPVLRSRRRQGQRALRECNDAATAGSSQSLELTLGRPSTQGPVGSGRAAVTSKTLKAHGGEGANLILRWNVPAGNRSAVDLLVHFHGFIGAGKTLDLERKERYSGADFTPPAGASGAGRQAPTLALIPQGFKTGRRSKDRSTDVYDFPVLTQSPDGLTNLVDEALDWFAVHQLGQEGGTLSDRRVILTAHSGGGARLLKLLAHHDPDEVYLFDALYQSPSAVVSWARARIAEDAAALAGIDESKWATYMSVDGGALRSLYTSGKSTTAHNLSLGQGVESALKSVSNAKIRQFLRTYYRVERTAVGHNLVPRTYGWQLLANAAADLTPDPKP